ncbi:MULTISPECIES: DUF1802 family protein [unclassified Microcoleus]|uniref:DUF1802 family protein n=1 Tax=unclassified Microcoleus TaxID=2642155 RepID=UPI001DBA02AC|nr:MULTISPECIES: DUF1802 family protein [unclassified Microcoleus]MCC3433329.1 DUF1802 family protein [Microcoleus sp. PH2017_04_SCI_O_A]TAE07517.1 MAG: DUF1802 family protein [Oscillatoriales cyanobacterium]MCC3414905.1 DUF1802 family protein [Microcoleus sp. PH2017_02_FOX_O_A]MCC3519057.1 DUF1802 family protein [Microcoleus sp. PH2017_18_LLB_O_A]MCC3537783.1 DUF1802 family protein [Microcoleus sp. PH2017_25_DOB_D_A]
MKSTTRALKEWNVAVNALEGGRTIVLLRKGGIREQAGQFNVSDKQVLLYPTFEHQQPDLLKPDFASQVKTVESGWHPETIRIGSWAEITDVFLVAWEPAINALFPYHIWNEKFVGDRLKWKKNQPIYILLLRAYRLAETAEIQYISEYGGCRSWIDLASPISLEGSEAVLSDREYIARSNEIRNLMANPPNADGLQKITTLTV